MRGFEIYHAARDPISETRNIGQMIVVSKSFKKKKKFKYA